MRTTGFLLFPLLAVALCMGFVSCSDDEEGGDKQLSELTLSWEIEASDDLLDVADISYVLCNSRDENKPTKEPLLANSTSSRFKSKAPCLMGIQIIVTPKETPTVVKEKYDLTLSVKTELFNEKGKSVGSNERTKQIKGLKAEQVSTSLGNLQKQVDSIESFYHIDSSGKIEKLSYTEVETGSSVEF